MYLLLSLPLELIELFSSLGILGNSDLRCSYRDKLSLIIVTKYRVPLAQLNTVRAIRRTNSLICKHIPLQTFWPRIYGRNEKKSLKFQHFQIGIGNTDHKHTDTMFNSSWPNSWKCSTSGDLVLVH